MIKDFLKYKNKKVVITGHTGFKGSWLTLWLSSLGADVIGISNSIPTKPSNFQINKIKNKIKHFKVDIRDKKKLSKIILQSKPDFIFHLAAQSLVKKSYKNPKYTFETNSIGTLNLLETLRLYKPKKICSVVLITSDKSYKNLELKRGYKENDILGGYDPYSASKGCAELIIQSYLNSYLLKNKNLKISVARAGNVIGGGDWSDDRLIPDCVRSINSKKKLLIRFPNSTRPWQHVFEALYGYLALALLQKNKKMLNGNIFNFGPNNKSSMTVLELVRGIKSRWGGLDWKIVKPKRGVYESQLLKLNSNKAKKFLKWECILNINQSLDMIVDWYKYYYSKEKNIYKFSTNQIAIYENLLKKN